MDSNLWMNYESNQEDPELSALHFPLWPHEFETREDDLFGTPLMQGGFYSNPFYHTQDPFLDELATLCDGNNGPWDKIIMEARMLEEEHDRTAQYNIKGESTVINKQNHNGLWDAIVMDATIKKEDERIAQYNIKEESTVINKQNHNRIREERVLTFEEVSQYFYMPIIQTAKELNVGLTLLKKRCRELGIPRWPHRKMKSMQKLINDVQELGGNEGSVGDMKVEAIKILEEEQKSMEMTPSVEMHEKTRRLRQACFKANYKKRKLVALAGKERLGDC